MNSQLNIKNQRTIKVLNEQRTVIRVRRILWIILAVNLATALLKIIVGNIIKSASMTADGYHSLTDGSSNIIGLIGIKLASKPVDEDHPYGHNKFETLAGLFISVLLFFLGIQIIIEAVGKFLRPVELEVTLPSLAAMVITLILNILVSIIEYRKGKQLNSGILISDSLHTRSDVYVSAGVLATLVGIKAGLPSIIDPVVSLIVSGFIFHAGYEILKLNGSILVDKAQIDSQKIRDIAMSFPQVKDIHNIRSRGDSNNLYVDMHIMTDPDMSIEKSHDLIHGIENEIRSTINESAQVNIHVEPYK